MGQGLLDLGDGVDEVAGEIVVLLDAGGDGEDVGVEDNVLGREAYGFGQDFIAALANPHHPLAGIGLALLVEGHDHHRSAVAHHFARLGDKGVLAFLEADGIDHALALKALEPGFDDRELGRIDHHRHARDIGLGGGQVEERSHRRLAVEHGVVHVDVDDLGAARDLGAGDVQRPVEVAFADQLGEFGRTGDVGALADIDEPGDRPEIQGLQPRQSAAAAVFGHRPRLDAVDGGGDRFNVVRRRAAAAADHVDETAAGEFAQVPGHEFRGVVVAAEFVGQSGVGIDADVDRGNGGDFLDVLAQFLDAEGTVETDADRVGVGDGIPERLRRLAGKGAPRGIGDGARNHHRQFGPVIVEIFPDRVDGGLAVQGIEDGLDQQHVDAALDEPVDGFAIGSHQIVEGDVVEAGVVDVGR